MPAFAMVVVVEAGNEKDAHHRAFGGRTLAQHDATLFIGDPWEVKPKYDPDADQVVVEPEFDTLDCLVQHPKR